MPRGRAPRSWGARLRDRHGRSGSAATNTARHARSYGTGVFVSDPLHDRALIETEPNALRDWARDERRLLQLQRELVAVKLLIVDGLGYVPLSPTEAELLFEVFSQRYGRGSSAVNSNLPFEDRTSVPGSERLTGAPLDRLTRHVSILNLNGDSYRLRASRNRRGRADGRAEQN